MKKWITNNWPLKLMSVLLAVLIWIVIVNIDNPVETVTIRGIPIQIVNDDLFREQGKTYTVVGSSAPTASVRVTERWKTTTGLSASDFTAVADFADIYQEGQVPVTVTCSNSAVSSEDFVVLTPSLEIQVENLSTITQEVTVQTTGDPAEGYTIGKTTAAPNLVTITAPASFAERVRQAVVTVDVSGASEEVTAQSSIQLLDAYGDVMSTTGLAEGDFTISSETADATVEILNMKEVPITVSVSGVNQVADGYRYTGHVVNPETVSLSGLRSALGSASIEIPNTVASVAGASSDVTFTVSLAEYLPAGVSLVEGEPEEATITLRVEPLEERSISIPVSSLTVTGLEDGLEYTLIGTSFTLRVEGLAEDLDRLAEEPLTGTVDVSGLGAGMHTLPVEVTLPDQDAYSLVSEPAVNVQLTEQAAETEPVTGSEAETESAAETGSSGAEEAGESAPSSS